MLRYEINHAAGVPQTIVSGFAPRGEADHWTATATGRAAADSVVRNFIATRSTVNASYHVLDWHDHAAEITYAMEIVPLNRASHSMNPAKAFVPKDGGARERERFAEVHRILARDSDPNADSIAVSFVGMPADLARAVACPVYREDRRQLSRVLRGKVPTLVERPHFGHGWIQPVTRYEMDAAPGGADLLIAPVLYAAEPQEEDMGVKTRPVRQQWDIPAGMAFWTEGPSMGERKLFTAAARLWSNGESLDGNWRRLEYEDTPGAGEELWAWRANMTPVHGTRNPATGFGSPTIQTTEVVREVVKEVPTGLTEEDLERAAEAERSRIAAAEAQRIRDL